MYPGVLGFPGGSVVKNPVNAGDLGSIPALGRSPGEGDRLHTPVFCPGECHGLNSPWGRKESGTTEQLSLSGDWLGFPGGASGRESACQCRRCKRLRFDPWVGKIPWRRPWQPTPVFLSGESHGQRSLAGYSP